MAVIFGNVGSVSCKFLQLTTGTVSGDALKIVEAHKYDNNAHEDIDLESGEYVPVGHILKFILDFGLKCFFEKVELTI